MKLCNISDTHNQHWHILEKMEDSDLLFHAGDFTTYGTEWEIEDFFSFLLRIERRYDKIVFCAGNHDFFVMDHPEIFREMVAQLGNKFIYLEDEEYVYNGVKIYGTPWSTTFGHWAFMLDRMSLELAEKRFKIPNDTNILISHTAPFGILDGATSRRLSMGCELLRQRVDSIKPKVTLFGHFHTGYGVDYKMQEDRIYINASIIPPFEEAKFVKDPIIIDMEF